LLLSHPFLCDVVFACVVSDVVVAGVVVVAAVSLIWLLRCVVVFIADVHWGFLVIVGVDGVVAAVFVLTLGFFVQSR
jgi:hypothetical protein